MTAEEMAAKLTPSQKDAVLGKWGWNSPWAQEEGENELERLGIWNHRQKRFREVLTPLGMQVRAILESNHDRA